MPVHVRSPRRIAVPVLVASVTGAVLAAAVAFAVIPDADGVIYGCIKPTGVLRVIDYPKKQCASTEKPLNWNQSGPQGPTGTARAFHRSGEGRLVQYQSYSTLLSQITLPPGSYVLSGNVNASGGGNGYDLRLITAIETHYGCNVVSTTAEELLYYKDVTPRGDVSLQGSIIVTGDPCTVGIYVAGELYNAPASAVPAGTEIGVVMTDFIATEVTTIQ